MGTDIWGIDDGYEDALGVWRETPAITRSALRAAMGGNPASQPAIVSRMTPPVSYNHCRTKRRVYSVVRP